MLIFRGSLGLLWNAKRKPQRQAVHFEKAMAPMRTFNDAMLSFIDWNLGMPISVHDLPVEAVEVSYKWHQVDHLDGYLNSKSLTYGKWFNNKKTSSEINYEQKHKSIYVCSLSWKSFHKHNQPDGCLQGGLLDGFPTKSEFEKCTQRNQSNQKSERPQLHNSFCSADDNTYYLSVCCIVASVSCVDMATTTW